MHNQHEIVDQVRVVDFETWSPKVSEAQQSSLCETLERGGVLYFPHLNFKLHAEEARFLTSQWSDGKAKNINLRPSGTTVRGATGSAVELADLQKMLARYALLSAQLVDTLFPHYKSHYRPGGTSFRPRTIEVNTASWRKDDTRLHV